MARRRRSYGRTRKRRKTGRRSYRRGYRKGGSRKYRSGKALRRIKIGSVKGYGGYKVQSNSILSGGMSPPKIMNTFTNDGVVIRHREYLKDVKLLGADTGRLFTINETIELNPGMESLPWLRGIAENWKEYEWHGVLLEYKPLTALATTSGAGAMGSVMVGTHYDMYEKPFVNKQEMLNSEYTTSGKPQMTQIHPIECKRSQTPVSRKWVRTGSYPAGADKRLYDHCRIEVCTEGIPGPEGSAIGELWITFEVCLFKPKMVDKRDFMVNQDVETFKFTAGASGTTDRYLFYNYLTYGQAAPHINNESSMNGYLIPAGINALNVEPYYRWNEGDIEVGDVFRISVYYTHPAGADVMTQVTPGYHGCEAFDWYNDTTSVILGPNPAAGASYRYIEHLVRILEKSPGIGDLDDDLGNGPYFQWNHTIDSDTNEGLVYYIMFNKIRNVPV